MKEEKDTSFLKRLIISGSGISSKRFMGIVCIVFSMIFACLGFFFGDIGKVDTTVSTVLIQFLTAGIALFGVTVLDKSINNKDKDRGNNNHYPGNYGGGKDE